MSRWIGIAVSGLPAILAVTIGATLAASQPAFAAGMPQLAFGNPLTLGQLFWGAVIFLVLYLVLSRSALPRVGSVLDERRARIDGDLDAAKSARNEADRAIIELRRARRDAAAEASAMVDKVVAEARAQAASRTAEMNARLEADIARAEIAVTEAREAAMGSIRSVAAGTTRLLVERLVGHDADEALVDAKVDAVLAARPAN